MYVNVCVWGVVALPSGTACVVHSMQKLCFSVFLSYSLSVCLVCGGSGLCIASIPGRISEKRAAWNRG